MTELALPKVDKKIIERKDEIVKNLSKISGSDNVLSHPCLLYTSPSPRDRTRSRMPSSA